VKTLLDVKLRVQMDQTTLYGHFWDGVTWRNDHPVALCNEAYVVPRDPTFFLTPEEMKQIPFCTKCLSMVKR
jgi:hypothetical protein